MNKRPRYNMLRANTSRNNTSKNTISRNSGKEVALPTFDFMHGIEVLLKTIMLSILVSLTTCFYIFVENVVVQSNFLAIKEISVSGTHILSKEEVIEQAELFPEDNIFSVNLRHTRLKIISHPWIEDASIKRSLPSKIIITIKEENPLAVVHIPDRADIILNHEGVPFTENDAIGSEIYINDIKGGASLRNSNIKITSGDIKITKGGNNTNKIKETINRDKVNGADKGNVNSADDTGNANSADTKNANNLTLPIITGLRLSKQYDIYGFSGRLYESVMKLLLMKKDEVIQRLLADEESGIQIDIFINAVPLQLAQKPVKIKIGFDNYEEKFKIIRHIINYMQKNKIDKQICLIDLINPENVVIKIKDITGTVLPKVNSALPEHI